jgi:hypothetical protein
MHGLLYLTAVRDDRREQEHRQCGIDVDPASLRALEIVGPIHFQHGLRSEAPTGLYLVHRLILYIEHDHMFQER